MKLKMILILLLAVLLIFACQKENSTEPVDENIHPQQDIPWPSLADSPWPMYHHDPQSTGRSQYKGPREGKIKWIFKPVNDAVIWPAIIIGPDSVIYFTTQNEKTQHGTESFLYAIYPNGTLKWKYQINDYSYASDYAPLIASDSTIFLAVIGRNDFLYAISFDGTLKWKKEFRVASQLNIGIDGTIYFRDENGYLCAVSSKGDLLWRIIEDNGFYYYGSSISPDGKTIYSFSKNQQNKIAALCAISTEGNLLWKYNLIDSLPRNNSLPLVDVDGNIYFGIEATPLNKSKFYSVSREGKLNWFFECKEGCGGEESTIDLNGYIYFYIGTSNFATVAIDYFGRLRWQQNQQEFPYAGYICDKEGVVYVFHPNIKAYTNDGDLLWQINLDENYSRIASPAIGADGTLYFGTFGVESKIYAIK